MPAADILDTIEVPINGGRVIYVTESELCSESLKVVARIAAEWINKHPETCVLAALGLAGMLTLSGLLSGLFMEGPKTRKTRPRQKRRRRRLQNRGAA